MADNKYLIFSTRALVKLILKITDFLIDVPFSGKKINLSFLLCIHVISFTISPITQGIKATHEQEIDKWKYL
jgi:hypothetical protein